MTDGETFSDTDLSLYYFQVHDLFPAEDVDAVLRDPRWASKYPNVIQAWKSPDRLTSGRVLLPGEIVRTIAGECACVGDFYADPDGQTLYIVGHGRRPVRWLSSTGDVMKEEEIVGAKYLSAKEALVNYGADAIWLAQEYGTSRRGERDNRFRSVLGKTA